MYCSKEERRVVWQAVHAEGGRQGLHRLRVGWWVISRTLSCRNASAASRATADTRSQPLATCSLLFAWFFAYFICLQGLQQQQQWVNNGTVSTTVAASWRRPGPGRLQYATHRQPGSCWPGSISQKICSRS
jgi:hypothetical protein